MILEYCHIIIVFIEIMNEIHCIIILFGNLAFICIELIAYHHLWFIMFLPLILFLICYNCQVILTL